MNSKWKRLAFENPIKDYNDSKIELRPNLNLPPVDPSKYPDLEKKLQELNKKLQEIRERKIKEGVWIDA